MRHLSARFLAALGLSVVSLAACGGSVSPVTVPVAEADSAALAAERASGTLRQGALGVPPFAVEGADENLASLSYALADLVAADLARSSQLTLVERTRLGDVLRELDLAASGRVDPATAPRAGRLIGARRLILGGLSTLPADGGIRLGVRLADVERGTVQQSIDAQAPLADILAAEKALVFRIFDALGVTLDPAERAQISQRPTANLAALLAYGSGVRAEYVGDYRLAAAEYRRAARLDPNFAVAKQRADDSRARAETGVTMPLGIPGLRTREAAVGAALDRINRPLDQITTATRTAGGAADPSFPITAATVLITVTRP